MGAKPQLAIFHLSHHFHCKTRAVSCGIEKMEELGYLAL